MTEDRYRTQLASLAGALRAVPPDRYRWFGQWSPQVPKQVRDRVDAETRRHYLVAQLRSQLYRQFYLPGQVVPLATPATNRPAANESPFVRDLIAANHGAGSWQPGWRIVQRKGDALLAARDGLALWVPATGWREVPGAAGEVAVRLPKGFRSQSPGFYLARSDEPFAPSPDDILVRLYWHLAPAGTVALMTSVTETLNAARVPFQVKVLNDPSAYSRNDAAVLYITKQELRRASGELGRIYQAVRAHLLPGEPALTRQLAPGLGLAEDPGNGDSFGMHRCGLLAEAFIEAAEQRVRAPDQVLGIIEERFAREGLDPARPYLGPGSAADYDELLPRRAWTVAAEPVDDRHDSAAAVRARHERFLAGARAIGDHLASDAVWHDGRCTWLGELEHEPEANDAGAAVSFGAIGPDLYAGTAGVALFLAQLFSETGDERYASAARGAIAQSARGAAALPAGGRLGFYSGWPGIAWAAARVGALVDDDRLARSLPRQLFDERAPASPSTEPDLLSGAAGAILALLELARMTGDEGYLATAIVLGERLLATAKRDAQGMWWPIKLPTGRRALTGFAHGAAGIATALLTLFAETREIRFAEAARAAFAFERRNFSPRLGNWLDLRYPVVGPRDGPSAQAMSAWCHGAGGIALSRLVAWQVLRDDVYLTEADVAVERTSTWLKTTADSEADHWSLCHGLPGSADILLTASAVLPGRAALRGVAARVADTARAASEAERPSVAPLGPDRPGLMLGLAGLGYFYLRLARPDTPSILLPLPVPLSH